MFYKASIKVNVKTKKYTEHISPGNIAQGEGDDQEVVV